MEIWPAQVAHNAHPEKNHQRQKQGRHDEGQNPLHRFVEPIKITEHARFQDVVPEVLSSSARASRVYKGQLEVGSSVQEQVLPPTVPYVRRWIEEHPVVSDIDRSPIVQRRRQSPCSEET